MKKKFSFLYQEPGLKKEKCVNVHLTFILFFLFKAKIIHTDRHTPRNRKTDVLLYMYMND